MRLCFYACCRSFLLFVLVVRPCPCWFLFVVWNKKKTCIVACLCCFLYFTLWLACSLARPTVHPSRLCKTLPSNPHLTPLYLYAGVGITFPYQFLLSFSHACCRSRLRNEVGKIPSVPLSTFSLRLSLFLVHTTAKYPCAQGQKNK